MALFLLRVVQMGLTTADLDFLEYGEVIDMFIEERNDDADYDYRATQKEMDGF